MSGASTIEWTDATWNPVRGCRKISPGCKHCYAETFAERFRGVPGHAYERGFDPRTAPDQLEAPLRWRKPRLIFVNSMSDLFLEDWSDDYIAAVFGVMAACERHVFQVLTKRIERAARWFEWMDHHAGHKQFTAVELARRHIGSAVTESWGAKDVREWPLPNVRMGTSVEDQKYGKPRIDVLRRIPAAVRFLSIEPLLEDLGEVDLSGIDQVIVGAESGRGARPMNEDWVRRIRDQALEQSVSFFYKQGLDERGRKISLPMLDGRQWAEQPV
jgi:protein gp37